MAPVEPFPIFVPGDARRAFGTEDTCRRIARTAHWTKASRVLELNAGAVVIQLAKEIGCQVVGVDPSERALETLRERVKAHGVSDRVELKVAAAQALPFGEAMFDGIVALGRVPLRLEDAAQQLRKHLTPKGRLVLTYPVKVGRSPHKAALEFWSRKLGEPLRLPRETLMAMESAGYEPELIETLGDSELDDHYREMERHVDRESPEAKAQVELLREEISVHRAQGGKASVSLALVIARRREKGEKPPLSRDSG